MAQEDWPEPIGSWGLLSTWKESDEAQREFQEKQWASLLVQDADRQRFLQRLWIIFARFRLSCIYIALVVIGVGLVIASLSVEDRSFTQTLLIELASGAAVFVAAVPILAVSANWKTRAFVVLAVGSVAAGIICYMSSGVPQAYWLEASVSLALLASLDLAFKSFEARAQGAVRQAEARALELEADIEKAEDVDAPKYFAPDGGTMRETVDAKEMGLYLDICEQLASDGPIEIPAIVGRVETASHLMRDSPTEFVRRRSDALELRRASGSTPASDETARPRQD
jgi:hypothetical protein